MKISTRKVLILMLLILSSCMSYSQLIISQVYEGINDNKWIEITNTSLQPINLSSPIQYKIGIWETVGTIGNGSISGSPTHSIPLVGTLQQGQKFLIKNTNAATNVPHAVMPSADLSNTTVASFDGNDALAIYSDSATLIDSFGEGINYSDASLVRLSSVVYSKSTFTVSEWTLKSLANIAQSNSFLNDYIGKHYFSGFFYFSSPSLSSLQMTYGGTSSISSFQISRVASIFLVDNAGLTPPPPPGLCALTYATPPLGFEISTSPNFTSAIGTSNMPLNLGDSCEFTKTIYIRLAQNLNVGSYSGSIGLASQYIPSYSIATHPVNTVVGIPLTITGLSVQDKLFDGTTTAEITGVPVLNGLLPTDFDNVTIQGEPIANFADELVGENKPVLVSGYALVGSAAANYILNQPIELQASILPVTTINLKLFIQGFYDSQQHMTALKTIQNASNDQFYVDDVLVELRDLLNFQVVDSTVSKLQADGTLISNFPTLHDGMFYVTVKGSNSIQTWSSIPIAVGSTLPVNYDFSDDSNKAFGNNLVNLDNGVYGIYSGDINADGNIDNTDYTQWETDSNNFSSGIFVTDLNGDGNVDNSDYTIWETNSNSFVFSTSPQN